MASPSTPPIDPFTLYNIPSGFIGLINDLLSIYIFTCLLSGRIPLQPKRKLQYRHRTTAIVHLSFTLMTALNFFIFHSLEYLNGPWQELYYIMTGKLAMTPFCGFLLVGAATLKLKAEERAKVAGRGKMVVKEGRLEIGGMGEDKDDGYPNTLMEKIFNEKSSELPALPKEENSTAASKEIEEIGIKLLALATEAPKAQREKTPPTYVAGAQLDTEDPSIDLEKQQSIAEDTSSDEASQSLLSDKGKAREITAQDNYSYSSSLFLFLMALLSLIPAGFLWAQISMAVQSIKQGNRDTLVVAVVFGVLFFAGVIPYALAIGYTAMRRAKSTPGKVSKVENLVIVPLLVSSLLVVFYGDMNIGAISGRLAGMGPVMDRNAMVRYWVYMLASKLTLFCH